ncbi:MAG: B12-binding domain-containing radical SAM protein [Candidatus Scalindua sp.]|jgi:anaerobic magnesium-protoporphyrin IX monomethyl ester cyclase|nr:B12-binding domain-containing radical SAM protein [Candidatus Scalindua sp.]
MKILLVVYDNDSYMNWFPQGLAYIAAVLIRKGYKVTIYNQDKFHYPDEHLTNYLDINKFDVVGVGVIAGYYQYKKLLKISEAINKSKNRPFYVIGGHGPSPEPEFFIKKTKADTVVMGEGELTIVELMETLASNGSLDRVDGIAYSDGEKVKINKRRQLIKDIDTIPFPAYEQFPMDFYRLLRTPYSNNNEFVMPILSGRGCTFECTFCYRLDAGFRPRSNESIIEEIKLLIKDYQIKGFIFSDELLMSSVKRTSSLCEDIISADLNIKWSCNGRLNYAKKDLLKLMKRAGCVFVNYGIEAMDDQVLKNMKKGLTTDQIVKGVEATLDAKISPGLNIIFGNLGDNKETLNKGVEFLLKYSDCSQLRTIRPVTAYPGSPLYYYAIEKELLKDCEDFYENKHINSDLVAINFTDLSDEEFHHCLLDANKRLLTHFYQNKLADAINEAERLYLKKDTNFRGFR